MKVVCSNHISITTGTKCKAAAKRPCARDGYLNRAWQLAGGCFLRHLQERMCVVICGEHVSPPVTGEGERQTRRAFTSCSTMVWWSRYSLKPYSVCQRARRWSGRRALNSLLATDVPEEDCHPGPSLDRQRLWRPQRLKSDHGTPMRARLAWSMMAGYATTKGSCPRHGEKRQSRLRKLR